MSYSLHKKNSTITTQVMCAIVFWLFSLAWLYWIQADLLTVAQFIYSDGQTHYNQTVGALLLTLVLQLVQQIVARFVKLNKRTHSLTYLPSMLILAWIGDFSVGNGTNYTSGIWPWLAPFILLLWGGVVYIARQALPFDSPKEQTGVFSRCVWINMFTMTCMMLIVALVSNTNAVFHFRSHVEVSILEGDFDEALRTGAKSHETDESLTMLRAFALSKHGLLPDRLFEYPVAGRGDDLLPFFGSKSRTLLIPVDSFYAHLGARPIAIKSMTRYFELLEKDSLAKPSVADYQLCALLIDKKLDAFAHLLPRYYSIEQPLPKHYREAATMYVHLRAHPKFVYHNEVLEEDWRNFQELERGYPDKRERKGKVAEHYSNSYWYYYFYE